MEEYYNIDNQRHIHKCKKTCLSDSFFSGYWWSQVLFFSKCMHRLQACLFKYITVSAFCIYALHCKVKMPLKGEVGGRAF